MRGASGAQIAGEFGTFGDLILWYKLDAFGNVERAAILDLAQDGKHLRRSDVTHALGPDLRKYVVLEA